MLTGAIGVWDDIRRSLVIYINTLATYEYSNKGNCHHSYYRALCEPFSRAYHPKVCEGWIENFKYRAIEMWLYSCFLKMCAQWPWEQVLGFLFVSYLQEIKKNGWWCKENHPHSALHWNEIKNFELKPVTSNQRCLDSSHFVCICVSMVGACMDRLA